MPELLILVGISGSGKSTFAKELVKTNNKYVRVNRDDMRQMLKGQDMCHYLVEDLITIMCNSIIKEALENNMNVVVDNTHLRMKYITTYKLQFGSIADIKFKVFDVPVEFAIERDSKRDRVVGEDVIRRMYDNYKELCRNYRFDDIPKS